LILAFFLRWRAADHAYISQWDEAYHALVAKNFLSHPLVPTLRDELLFPVDYKNWTDNHIWLHKPPLAPWLMALGLTVLGTEHEVALRFASVVVGTIAVLLTFLLTRELFKHANYYTESKKPGIGRPYDAVAGLVASLLHALSPLHIRLISGTVPTDHVDAIASFFVELAFLLFLVAARRESWHVSALGGIVLGAGYLTKSLPSLIPLAAALPVFYKDLGRWRVTAALLLVALAAFAATALPWQVYSTLRWPAEAYWESFYTFRHLFEAVEGHGHPWTFYFEVMPLHLGGFPIVAYTLVLTALMPALLVTIRRRNAAIGAVLLWMVIPYIIFSLTATKMYSYVAPALPAIYLLVGWVIGTLIECAAHQRATQGKTSNYIRAALVGLLGVVVCYVLPVAVERVRADYSQCPWNNLYDYPVFRTKMLAIASRPGKKALFNVGDDKRIQAMFYTGAPAYKDVPNETQVRELQAKGYALYFLIDGFRTNFDRITLLAKAGLLKKGYLVMIGPPRKPMLKNPYFN
jgi:hypothetical protein